MKPRYEPSWGKNGSDKSALIGHVGPVDVYYEYDYGDNKEEWCLVVGPDDRKLNGRGLHNFDVYVIKDRCWLEMSTPDDLKDIHVELVEMCEIMQLLQEKGYLDG